MSIEQHAADYKDDAWRAYSLEELARWVVLLTLRASHRSNIEKREKDLADAQTYAEMFARKFEAEAQVAREAPL